MTQDLLKRSDLLLSIGTRFRGIETSNWSLDLPKEHISIDADLNAFNRNYPVEYGLVGDAKNTLRQLIEEVSKQDITEKLAYINEVESVRKQVRTSLRESIGAYKHFADEIRNLLPDDSILVRDVTVPAYTWGNR